ncbi:hypothetical protein UPYG_G00177820 [Umbra pygmaea]|uniref:Fibronectin type-III domain-containing protein n=1 Tax=Umbra pygmaea TaxID=75934 RepID=A0ABD0WQ08_UMBPY
MMHFSRSCLMVFLTFSLYSNRYTQEAAGCKHSCPNISKLHANVATQNLEVRWLINHTSIDTYEIQVGRTKNFFIIHNTNVSSSTVGKDSVLTWTWVSTLPLQCADHSVRMRCFCNHSDPSDWSQWITNYGDQETVDRFWKKTTMFPYEQVLKEGSTILFCCVPPRGVHITNMSFNSTSYPLINITDQVKAIQVHNLNITEASGSGVYSWCEDTTARRNTYCSNFISFYPQRPENLTCSTEDLTTITCTWNPGRPANLFGSHRRKYTLYIENFSEHPITCGESSCSVQALPGLEHYQVSVVVRNQLGEERQSYTFNITDRVFPVPERVTVSPGVNEANVSWVLRGNLSGLDLLCQVSVEQVKPNRQARQADGPESESALMPQVCHEGLKNQCNVTLQQLLPNTQYTTKVRCSLRGNPAGRWTQTVNFNTYPVVTLDVWRRVIELSHDRRNVTILWTPQFSGSAFTVKIKQYQLFWKQNGGHWILVRVRDQTQAEISIGPGQCYIILQAVISTGSSIPAHITIPPVEKEGQLTAGSQQIVTRVTGSASGGFNIFWEKQENITCGYTVEWCILGSGVPCNLQWRRVPVRNTSVSLPAEDFEAGRRYNFDIYGCTEEGDKLLAIYNGYSQELSELIML